MPQANVWIKKENWDYWQAIDDKSVFINSMIHHYGIGSHSSDSNPYTHAAVEDAKHMLGTDSHPATASRIIKSPTEPTYEPINT